MTITTPTTTSILSVKGGVLQSVSPSLSLFPSFFSAPNILCRFSCMIFMQHVVRVRAAAAPVIAC